MKKIISAITFCLIIAVFVMAIILAIKMLLYMPTTQADLWFKIIMCAFSVFIIASIMCLITAVVILLLFLKK